MAICGKCDSTMFEGHPCIGCGHVTMPPPPDGGPTGPPGPGQPVAATPPEPSAPRAVQARDDDDDGGVNMLVIGVAVLAIVLIAGAAFALLGGGGPEPVNDAAPSELASADEVEPVLLDETFCREPGAIAGAPEPSSTTPNMFAAFTKADALGYVSDSDAASQFLLDEWAAAGVTEASYGICIDGTPGEDNETCRGYDQGLVHKMFSKEYTYRMYELASGDLVSDGPVESLPMECPGVTFTGSQTIQAVDAFDLSMRVADEVIPAGGTSAHLGKQVNYLDPHWCSTPAALDGVAAEAAGPGILYLGSWPFSAVENVEWQPSRVTHVACASLTLSEEEPAVCEFTDGSKLRIARGTYDVTVVDAQTGEVVANQQFAGGTGCPGVILGDPPREPRNPSIGTDAREFVLATVGAPESAPTEGETESVDG